MLTLEMLNSMPENTIFATGVLLDNEDGLFMNGSNKELRWIAVRGIINDWSIYCSTSDKSIEYIERVGDKVNDERNIRKCVECSDGAFTRYRH